MQNFCFYHEEKNEKKIIHREHPSSLSFYQHNFSDKRLFFCSAADWFFVRFVLFGALVI